jgi:hypothetical protein
VTDAIITLNRPNGVIDIPHNAGGIYDYTSLDSADYQPGQTYTVTVTVDGSNYSDSIVACGNISIDATTVSWSVEGNLDLILIFNMDGYNYTAGPDLSSPHDISFLPEDAEYNVGMYVIKMEIGNFSGAASSSYFQTTDIKSGEIIK